MELAPFRAAHFDPGRSDLGSLLCPPYDVVEPAEDDALRQRSPHNVVHVVRPRVHGSAADSAAAYQRAASLLTEWRRDGVLRRDVAPAMYVYEQVVLGRNQRGILGAVRIRPDEDLVVLPHEDVFPGPVADRLALMEATDAQLEPILLVCTGMTDPLSLMAQATDRPAWLDATAPDDTRHRVWRLDSPADMDTVSAALLDSQALIADGHHRWATYQRLQHDRRAAGRGPGPWDYGLALLVAADSDGLTLSAIHRTVCGTPLTQVLAPSSDVDIQPLPGVAAASADALLAVVAHHEGAQESAANPVAHPPGDTVHPPSNTVAHPGRPTGAESPPVAIVLSDGQRAVLVRAPAGTSGRRAAVAATVTAERLLPELFGTTDDDPRVAYHHEAEQALRDAIDRRGVAIILPAPRLDDVVALAGAGERMPGKSTSFGPKPRSGLVMRFLD